MGRSAEDAVQLTSPSAGSSGEAGGAALCDADAAVLRRRVRRRLVPWLCLIFFLALIDRTNLGFAALTMRPEIGMSDLQYGFGSSIFSTSYVAMQVPSVWIVRRLGAPATLTARSVSR